jgi:hypothetical protein
MPRYPVGKRRPVIEDVPEEPVYDDEYDDQPVQRMPGRRAPVHQEPMDDEEYDMPPVRQPPQRRQMPRHEDEDPRYRAMEEEYDRRPERRSIDRVTLIAFILFFIMLASTIGMAMYSNGTSNDLQDYKWKFSKEEIAHNTTEKSLQNMTTIAYNRNHTIFLLTQNLTAKTNTLNLTRQTLNSTKHILNDTVAEVNHLMTNNTELKAQVNQWKILHPYNVDNPAYAAFQTFYHNDKTNNRTYNDTTYNCQNFARDFKANASSHGIRCAFIILTYNSTNGHCLNAVSTADHGTVYIEPQSDTEYTSTQVAVGQLYQGKLIKSMVVIW